VPVHYKGRALGGFRIDTLVDDKVIVEIKSSQVLSPVAKRQLYNYLKAANLEVGLLLHFGPEPKFYREVTKHRSRL
jgi:GxxExxY protein